MLQAGHLARPLHGLGRQPLGEDRVQPLSHLHITSLTVYNHTGFLLVNLLSDRQPVHKRPVYCNNSLGVLCKAVQVILFLYALYTRSFDFSSFLLAFHRQNGMQRNKFEKRENETKEDNCLKLPLTKW